SRVPTISLSCLLFKNLKFKLINVCVCVQTQQITPQLALQVLLQFDKAINTALANRVRNRVNFRGSLNTYRFCDNVWTFVLNDVEFREVTELVKVDKVKIVACDGKSESTHNKTDKWQVQHTHTRAHVHQNRPSLFTLFECSS
uniref:Transcription initiation factor IIA subunit 2 n=1 Tax=Astatotilapia calliptera TaxID=8154 RepID=A0AAX7SSW2_ASTCA